MDVVTRMIRKTVRPELTATERTFVMLVALLGRKNGNTVVTQNDILITSEGVGEIVDRLAARGLIHKWINGGVVQLTLTDETEREARRWLENTRA